MQQQQQEGKVEVRPAEVPEAFSDEELRRAFKELVEERTTYMRHANPSSVPGRCLPRPTAPPPPCSEAPRRWRVEAGHFACCAARAWPQR